MSGGDGIGHGTGFQGGSGGINGHSGPGGPNSGHDTPYSDHSGWSSENNGWGAGGSVGGGQGWNGHGGDHSNNNNNGGKVSPAGMAFGLPGLAPVVAGGIGVTVTSEVSVGAAIAEILGKVAIPATSLWGIVVFSLLPSEIAKDDPNMMSKVVVTSLPASTVTSTPVNSLPLTQATVSVEKRVVDVVKDERQHIAVAKLSLPMSVPVVHAKPTKTPHVYSASVPGLPNITITTTKGVPGVKPNTVPQKGFTQEKTPISRPAGYNAGGSTHDFIVRFPDKDKQDSVYLSVTKPLTKDELKRRQDEENKRQRAWEETHSVEVAQRRYGEAVADLNNTVKKIGDMQAKLPGIVAATAKAKKISEQKLSGFLGYKAILKKLKKNYQNALAYETNFRAELATAIESRKAKEKNVSDKKSDIEEAKKKPRKGTTQEGHSYHPAPKDNEVKGFGEITRGKEKTPKQGGAGKRKRWLADKGKTILEWDSQHGEVEKYDKQGNHKGSFDHRTGKQLKGPVPGRNIKNYL